MKLTIHDDPDALSRRVRALRKLKAANVKVGLPAKAGGRLQFILAVQEHGSPIMRIPSRPVVRPALAKPATRSAMADAMKDAVRAAWGGENPRPAMESAGLAGDDLPGPAGAGKRAVEDQNTDCRKTITKS